MPTRPPLHRYEEIAGAIRTALARGVYGVGKRLPSERWFVREYDAQRGTVRQALGLLEAEGLIVSVGKSGWYRAEAEAPAGALPIAGRRVAMVTFGRPSGAVTEGVAQGLNEALGTAGVGMVRIDSTGPSDAEHMAAMERLIDLDADGIVVWPHGALDASPLVSLRAATPLVLIDRRLFGFEADCVVFDDRGGGRLVTEHLIERGHRRIAFLGDEPFAESVHKRWLGYRHALLATGIEPEETLTFLPYGRSEPAFSAYIGLLRAAEPTAVVCSNDGVASLLLLRLREAGLRVPEDVAVTGFGNAEPGYLDVMGLTTAAQPFAELGRAAGRLLLERLAEPLSTRGLQTQEIAVPMSLVARTSG